MYDDNRICILGLGYVGLTLAAVMSDCGMSVVGIDTNDKILESVQNGQAHFFEHGLNRLIATGLRHGRLRFYSKIPDEEIDVYIVTVGTPLDDRRLPRMDMLESVSKDIAGSMRPGALVVVRSTVRLGATENLVRPILDGAGHRYDLAMCPERTVEGRALTELYDLPQIVGGITPRATARASELFRRITPTIIAVSNVRTAEIIKMLDNCCRDLFFAFGNEVALLCEAIGISGREVISAANTGYERTNIARPGFVGGPCLEKDPHILMDSVAEYGFDPKLLRGARELNEGLVDHAFEFVCARLPKVPQLTIALLGLAFKGTPDTDDLRGSTGVAMARKFRSRFPQARLLGQDFLVRGEELHRLGMEPVGQEMAFREADAILIMNNHPGYRLLDYERLAQQMRRPGHIYDAWWAVPRNAKLPEGVTLHALGQ